MLANSPEPLPQSGKLSDDLHKPATFLHEVLDFIAIELPQWRDRADRKTESAETLLSSGLCAHLNGAARNSIGFDILQFRVEEPDEQNRGRRIDLVPAPCGVEIVVEGRRHTDFDALLPIECKRLPTPTENNRDEREYVISQKSTTGGIQRFKAGHHGAGHSLGAMIGYIQAESPAFWHQHIGEWIGGLVSSGEPGWSQEDALELDSTDQTRRLTVLRSNHERGANSPKIELRHLWLEMN
jgi:hypothetical protein